MEWQRGRTAAEVGEISNQLYMNSVTGQTPAPQPQQQQWQQPQPQQSWQPQQSSQPALPTQEDWLNDPQGAAQRQMQYYYQTQVAPGLQQNAQIAAQLARDSVRRDEPEMFAKYGPEIDLELNKLGFDQRTPTNIKLIVDMVRGRHYRDLMAEGGKEALRRAIEAGEVVKPGVTVAPTATSTSGVDLSSQEFPPMYKRALEKAGMTEGSLMEFMRSRHGSMYDDPADPGNIQKRVATWLKKANTGDIITERRFSTTEDEGVNLA